MSGIFNKPVPSSRLVQMGGRWGSGSEKRGVLFWLVVLILFVAAVGLVIRFL